MSNANQTTDWTDVESEMKKEGLSLFFSQEQKKGTISANHRFWFERSWDDYRHGSFGRLNIATVSPGVDRSVFHCGEARRSLPADWPEHLHPSDWDHRWDRVHWAIACHGVSAPRNTPAWQHSTLEHRLRGERPSVDREFGEDRRRVRRDIDFRLAIVGHFHWSPWKWSPPDGSERGRLTVAHVHVTGVKQDDEERRTAFGRDCWRDVPHRSIRCAEYRVIDISQVNTRESRRKRLIAGRVGKETYPSEFEDQRRRSSPSMASSLSDRANGTVHWRCWWIGPVSWSDCVRRKPRDRWCIPLPPRPEGHSTGQWRARRSCLIWKCEWRPSTNRFH